MTKNFWQKLKKPFFILAPMDDVTDAVFREVICKTYKPDVFFTEFTNVEGLISEGKQALSGRLKFTDQQRPIVAQLWGINPDNFYQAAKLCRNLGFDGIDLNFGCPDRTVTRNGACSAMINNTSLAKEIIEATKKGAGELPVSVKTRIGFAKIQTEEWIGFLLEQKLDALTVHGRTAKQMSLVDANWDEIKRSRELRDKISPQTIIIGNGDVKNYEHGMARIKETGVDGIMIGRGVFADVYCFAPQDKKPVLEIKDMLELLLYHTRLFNKTWGKGKNFLILRRFFKIYVSRFPGASELRVKLMETKTQDDVEKVIADYLSNPYTTDTITI